MEGMEGGNNSGDGRKPWLWDETHVPKVVGSNPSTVYWMDIFHIFCCKNCNVCLKRRK